MYQIPDLYKIIKDLSSDNTSQKKDIPNFVTIDTSNTVTTDTPPIVGVINESYVP